MSLTIQTIQPILSALQTPLVQRPQRTAKRVSNHSATQATPVAFGGYSKPQIFGGVIALNIGMTVVKTLVHGKAYEYEGFSEKDRKLLFIQEAVR